MSSQHQLSARGPCNALFVLCLRRCLIAHIRAMVTLLALQIRDLADSVSKWRPLVDDIHGLPVLLLVAAVILAASRPVRTRLVCCPWDVLSRVTCPLILGNPKRDRPPDTSFVLS